tara:strand:+ start:800 stop:1654 length:855 start_codon:yes stop_codon:yes gene_type:complete
MAKYRHRAATRSASAGDVMLAVDKSLEDYNEIKAYEAYLEELRKQAKKKRKWGGLGSLFGAIGGFLLGGPAGAMAGYTAGKSTGTLGASWDDYDDNKRELNKSVWKGGKFDHQFMQSQTKKLKDQNKAQRDADLLNVGIDAIMAGISIKGAGGFLKGADKIAWKDMTLKEQLNQVFNTKDIATKKVEQQTDKVLAGKGRKNVLDLVKESDKILNPTNIFGGDFTPFGGVPFRTAGAIGKDFFQKKGFAGEMANLIQSSEAIKRGEWQQAPLLRQWISPEGTFNK